MPSTQTLVYILLALALITLVVPGIRDFFLSKKSPSLLPDKNTGAGVLTLQLQAYERLVVLLERISPENLISRTNQPGLPAKEMQLALIQAIKGEYDHNVSQQIYVSRAAWDAVRNVKEQLVSLVNQVGNTLPETATALDLNRKLLELLLQKDNESPTRSALEVLNTEAKKLMK